MQKLRWPTTVTAKPKTSRQNQKPHGKTKNLTANPKTSRQIQKPHGKNKIRHDKTKTLTAKPKTSWQNQILHSKNQIPHGKSKYPRQNQSYFAFAVKYLVLPWGILFLPWGFWFCREVFGFAVMFLFLPWGFWFCRDSLGHRKKLQTRQLYRLTVNTSAYLARIQTSTHPPYTPTHFYQ